MPIFFSRATLLIPQTISEIPALVPLAGRVISFEFDPISQEETSEAFIGEWAEKRGIRDQLVIATKVLLSRSSNVLVDVETWPSTQPASSDSKTISLTRLTTRGTMPNLFMCL